MQNTGLNGGDSRGSLRAAVISKLKDDGDYDRLRLKIIRKIKENDELRSNLTSMVKQSVALNCPGAENMKPRQLLDAIHQEIGDKLMSQLSDGLSNTIRSPGGMIAEIKETVQSVYDKLLNPRGKDNGESSSHKDSPSVRNELHSNGGANGVAETDGSVSDGEPNEPPGFGVTDVHQKNKRNKMNQPNNISPPAPHNGKAIEGNKGDRFRLKDFPELPDNLDAPPGFSSVLKRKNLGDASDEDPDVPPGFG